ncbi:single-stranded DNA-binding protein, partial [Bifidobacterium breve]|uniref:single-stranded DNA-binding protein n=1 Tax=Bifidobacterium breve TaxID=1685 RepID=UPI000C80D885
ANFTIANNPRNYDRNSSQWVEGEPLFVRASVWGDYAQNVADTLTKGMRVIAYGRLRSQTWTDRQGAKRSDLRLEIEDIGPCLRFATAQVTRTNRAGGGSNFQQPTQQAAGAPDPWAQAGQAQEPPF